MATYLQQFNLTHAPFSKGTPTFWKTAAIEELQSRFRWLLESPGIGLLTGEAGVGKTAALHQLCQKLNPHEYQVIYHSETDFGRVDLYRQLAIDLGLEPAYRRASVWRAIKSHAQNLVKTQHRLPIWIIDEAHNLPADFFRDFPSFLNFTFDTESLITVWFVGHSQLNHILKRKVYDALHSRIQVFVQFDPINQADEFKEMIDASFKHAGASSMLLTDSGIDMIRLASKGKFRHTGQIIQYALQLACQKDLNHLPDELIKQTIAELQK